MFRYGIMFLAAFLLNNSLAIAEKSKIAGPATPPVYSTYQFHKDGKHIYFATQPLAAPEGVVGEVMRRDSILKKNLKKIGLEIVFYPFFNGPDTNLFMLRDEIDITMAGDMPTIAFAATGKSNISGIAKLGNASIITRNKFRSLKELKGKRIGVTIGTTGHYGLLLGLNAAGMQEDEVKIVPMNVSDMTRALAQNSIDAFSAWEPTPSVALASNKEFVAIHRFLNSSYLYQTKKFALQNPEASMQVHASFLRALRWLKKSESNLAIAVQWTIQSAELLANKAPYPSTQTIQALTRTDLLRFADEPLIPEAYMKKDGHLHKGFEFLKARGRLPADASWDNVRKGMSNQTLKTILANPGKYQLDEYRAE